VNWIAYIANIVMPTTKRGEIMRNRAISAKCPLCGGAMRTGMTTFTVDLDFGVVVVRHVPATVCAQCGVGLKIVLLLVWKK